MDAHAVARLGSCILQIEVHVGQLVACVRAGGKCLSDIVIKGPPVIRRLPGIADLDEGAIDSEGQGSKVKDPRGVPEGRKRESFAILHPAAGSSSSSSKKCSYHVQVTDVLPVTTRVSQ